MAKAHETAPENSSGAGLDQTAAQAITLEELQAQIAALTARLAEYEGPGVVKPKFDGEVPKYKLNAACFLENDTYYNAGDTLEYLGIPNLEMVPLNEAARKRLTEYIAALNKRGEEYAKAVGRTYPGLVMDSGQILAQALQDARFAPGYQEKVVPTVVMPTDRELVPVMPHTKEALAHHRRMGLNKQELIVNAEPAPKPKIGDPLRPIIGRGR